MALLPALVLIVGAFATVAIATIVRPERRQGVSELICYIAIAAAAGSAFLSISRPPASPSAVLEGFSRAVRLDELALFMTLTVLLAIGLSIVLSADAMKGQEAAQGEYYGLMLLAASGMLLLVESQELIT